MASTLKTLAFHTFIFLKARVLILLHSIVVEFAFSKCSLGFVQFSLHTSAGFVGKGPNNTFAFGHRVISTTLRVYPLPIHEFTTT